MKRSIRFITWSGLCIVSLLLSGVLCGCEGVGEVVGSGKLVTDEFDIKDLDLSEFIQVSIEDGFEVSITRSDNYSLKTTIDDNVVKYLVIDNEGYTLKLGLEESPAYRNVTKKAIITAPALIGLYLSEGSTATINGFDSSFDFNLKLTDGSQVTGNIIAGNCRFDLSSGSIAELSGSGDNTIITASDGSRLDLGDFEIDNAKVYICKGSEATLQPIGTISGKLCDGSHIFYYGNPALGEIDASNGSSVVPKLGVAGGGN